MARSPIHSREVKKYKKAHAGDVVGKLSNTSWHPHQGPHKLDKSWIRPDHDPDPSLPLSEQPAERLVGPMRALIYTLIQKRADELQEKEPNEDPDAIHTRAETKVFAWIKRRRPTKARLEREVFGGGKPSKRGPARRGPSDSSLLAAFAKLPDRLKRSKRGAAKWLQAKYPELSVETLRRRLAKVGKDSDALH
jgi:hypothetical protein